MAETSIIKADHLEDMEDFESIAQKLLSSEIYNKKLLSLLNRVMRSDAQYQHAKQALIMEYQSLVGAVPPEPEPEPPKEEEPA